MTAMNIACIMWNSRMPTFAVAAEAVPEVRLRAVSLNSMEDDAEREAFFAWAEEEADLLLAYRTQGAVWSELEAPVRRFGESKPVVSLGRGPDDWDLSSLPVSVVAKAQEYLSLDGEANAANLLRFLACEAGGIDVQPGPPQPLPWDGIYFPGAGRAFRDLAEFLPWAEEQGHYDPSSISVGILFYRSAWAAGNLAHVDALVEALRRRGCNPIPVFGAKGGGAADGPRSTDRLVEDCLRLGGKTRIDAALNMRGFFLGDTDAPGAETLKRLDVPVLSGVVAYRRSPQEWLDDPRGISNSIHMAVSGPEFDGVVEPLVVAAVERRGDGAAQYDRYIPIPERVERAADRLVRWARLGRKPAADRRVAFVLHNSPCSAVEATVGGGAKLDTLESVARILKRMAEAGYNVEPPESGEALIGEIMRRKAVSEFRWTSTNEVVSKGGCLDMVEEERYRCWFDPLPAAVRERMNEAWGDPPGEAKDGIPAAMVHEGKILVTGLRLGNAVVCVQPKRGCAGSRCDGQVCKILHDPGVPPTHQYVATYRWLEEEFGADCIVHVGTHGNLEFLPGKSVGLSGQCYPDICMGTLPHLYIYNADNPPEGVIAKRRGLATLVDHMQTVVTEAGTYQELEEIEALLAEHAKAAASDKARAHQIEHRVFDLAKQARLLDEMGLGEGADFPPFAEFAQRLHDQVYLVKNSGLVKGMHIFGQVPEGEDLVEMVYAILKYAPLRGDADGNGGGASFREILAESLGINLQAALSKDEGAASSSAALGEVDRLGKAVIESVLGNGNIVGWGSPHQTGDGRDDGEVNPIHGVGGVNPTLRTMPDRIPAARIQDIADRIRSSREIEALLSGFDGAHIPSGPSGLITRGRDDVLPTGRNFYSLDPNSVPTRSAFRIGQKLGDALVARFEKDQGRPPEHVALFWMANDIMWSDGEVMGQILDLLGCEPVWDASQRVSGFRVLPPGELRRPRLDLTIRVSGITRDAFPRCIELVDEAIQAVAALDEPPEANFLRKHVLAGLERSGADEGDPRAMREATYRIFAAQPGSYRAGVQLAVYASAWKEEKDLADVFLHWNGYAYGKGSYGVPAHGALRESMESVDLTYNKTASDESDLFGCCAYYGTHGGMTAAVRSVSGRDAPAYYGDTREPLAVDVRTLEEEVQRVVRAKLLNPKWIESMKEHGYKGAGDISKRIGRVYGWEASAQAVDDWVFDAITDTYVLDPEMRQWFEENNKWAFEEIARRMVEARERGLWNTDEERWEALSERYLEIESWMEEDMGANAGGVQGGSIDVMAASDVPGWSERMKAVLGDVRLAAQDDEEN